MLTVSRRRLIAVAAFAAVANIVDLVSTYAASPDLAQEWNVLQRQFGLGWQGLIGAKLVGLLLAVAGYSYYLRCRELCYPAPGLDLRHFSRHLTFGPEGPIRDATPMLRHLGVNLGFFWTGMHILVLWVAMDNLLLRMGHYWDIRRTSEMGYHMAQSVIVGTVVMARFYIGNFRRYQAASAPLQAPAAPPQPLRPCPTYERPV